MVQKHKYRKLRLPYFLRVVTLSSLALFHILPSSVLDPLVRDTLVVIAAQLPLLAAKVIGLAGTDEAELKGNRMELGIKVA